MTVVVENAMDQVEAYTKGNGVFPVPPEVAADNAKQEAKKEPISMEKVKTEPYPEKIGKTDPEAVVSADKRIHEMEASDDDVEGEDGLKQRQKREFTKAMQATIGKKHRMQREAQEFGQSQYREAKLAEARAAKLEADLAALKAQLQPTKSEEKGKPDRASFK